MHVPIEALATIARLSEQMDQAKKNENEFVKQEAVAESGVA
jgi:hypothetical protein